MNEPKIPEAFVGLAAIDPRKPKLSMARGLAAVGIFVAMLAGSIGGLNVLRPDSPFRLPIIGIFCYSGLMVINVFFKLRGERTFHLFTAPYVRQLYPRLLVLHCGYLLLLGTLWLAMIWIRPSLPHWTVAKSGPRNHSLVDWVSYSGIAVIWTIERSQARRILDRGKAAARHVWNRPSSRRERSFG